MSPQTSSQVEGVVSVNDKCRQIVELKQLFFEKIGCKVERWCK